MSSDASSGTGDLWVSRRLSREPRSHAGTPCQDARTASRVPGERLEPTKLQMSFRVEVTPRQAKLQVVGLDGLSSSAVNSIGRRAGARDQAVGSRPS